MRTSHKDEIEHLKEQMKNSIDNARTSEDGKDKQIADLKEDCFRL